METNEQGLTKEEKIMFSILGIILIIAIGVLIINSFSKNERKLDDTKTPITEKTGQEDKVDDETTTNNQKESLIEDEPLEDVVIDNVVSNKPSPKPTQTVAKPSKPEKEEHLGTGNVEVPGIIEWTFKDNIITNTYSNTLIKIDKNVLLNDGKEVEAVVTLRKLEGNSWNIVDISNNEIIVTEGLYKYYYTYGNQTKELLLTVKNELQIEKIELLTIDAIYEENSTITEEEFNKHQKTLLNSSIIKENNTYKLTTTEDNSTNLIPIVLTITEELTDPVLTSSTLGIIPSVENNNWYQELTNKDIILWLDLSVLDLTNQEINLNINGTNYYFNLNIEITIVEEPTDDVPESDTQNPDNTESEEGKKEESDEELIPEEEETKEENKEQPPTEEDEEEQAELEQQPEENIEENTVQLEDSLNQEENLNNILEDSVNSESQLT